MTTPPKARRYHASASDSVSPLTPPAQADAPTGPRIRLEVTRRAPPPETTQAPEAPQAPAAEDAPRDADAARLEKFMAPGPVDDGFGDFSMKRPPDAPSETPGADPAPEEGLEEKLAAIRAEKLTERQLRIARRIAGLHQIAVSSGEEAVLRLRERGIDPSHRTAVGSILSSEGSRAQSQPAPNPPALRPGSLPTILPDRSPAKRPALPSREDLTEEKRAAEIYRIQRDLAQRRRRRMTMLAIRLALFVILPTVLTGWYYYRIASPLYATVSQFQIQSAEAAAGGMGGIGAALGGVGTNTDAVAVQSYLTSRDAMLRLDNDLGFRAAFQDASVDPVKRLPADATNEATFGLYRDSVKIGYDPTEGVLNMEVIAPDPALSEQFSRALISYAEELVDALTARMRGDQMDGAQESYQDAEAKMLAAQLRVQELQERLGVLDPLAESGVVMGQVSVLEGQLTEKQLELGQLLANPSPVESRVTAVRGDISRLRELIAETRLDLTQGSDTRTSLAAVGAEMRVAEAELAVRQELLAAAAAQMEAARIEANKQVRYLSLSIAPIPPDEATYPRAFQNTLVAFLVFGGIYLMLSLTASILREQVST